MAVSFYMDVHIPQAISDQLRRRGVDVLTAIEDGRTRATDEQLLQRAAELRRVILTYDVRFKVLAEQRQRSGAPFAGVLYGHPLRGSIGQFVRDLELIGTASEPEEWLNTIVYLPF